jgi:predicted nuclease of predicted toxin-antitoxin system
VKLLLDQNLSHRIIDSLTEAFPGSTQVSLLGMGEAADFTIWEFANKEGFSIVTLDADFHEYSLLHGGPPLIVWLKCGNQPKRMILEKLMMNRDVIEHAYKDAEIWCIEIY